jgi:hypothetical protein
MNKIQGILDKSDYEGHYDYINFLIDGFWLDEKLDELYPGNMYKGLIPTLSYWMNREDERDLVWKRIIPNENEVAICPILMCPDDLDFSCAIIVAEIQNCGTFVQWKRLGINETTDWEAEKVGSKVRWFDNFPELNFEKVDYDKMVEDFKRQYNLEKIRIDNDSSELTGKDFEFLIVGDIDVSSNYDNVMTPNTFEWIKTVKNGWPYYQISQDEFSYSVEDSGIQMTFNKEIQYSKAKQIADEIIENILKTGQKAELIILDKSKVYRFH